MKFKDPLVTLNLMGGSLPIHMAMMANGFFTYYEVSNTVVNCETLVYKDVNIMIWAHAVSILLFVVSKFISRSEGNGIYVKSVLKTIRMGLFMYAFIKLQYTLG